MKTKDSVMLMNLCKSGNVVTDDVDYIYDDDNAFMQTDVGSVSNYLYDSEILEGCSILGVYVNGPATVLLALVQYCKANNIALSLYYYNKKENKYDYYKH